MPSSSKKSSFSRRFTDLINQKAIRRPSSRDGPKEGSITPPVQTTIPSSSSSPQSIQSRITASPQSSRYAFVDQHRLPVTFLPFVSTDSSFLKGLDVFGEESRGSPKSSFEFNESPVEGEDSWFRLSDDTSSAFDTLQTRARSESKATLPSSVKSMTIGWVREDGFKPIGEYD
jgi:hypothetical protein